MTNANAPATGSFPDPTSQPTMTVDETAPWLGVSRDAVYDACNRGDLPSLRVGRRVLVPTARLRDLLGMGAA